MLHTDGRMARVFQLPSVLGGEILRMQVIGDQLGPDVEQPAIVLDALLEGTEGLVVLQVPDVVAEESVLPPGQAEGVLELPAAGQNMPAEVACRFIV
jgi:hypothetical protein